ncbi:MAG: hypothetical protein ACRCS6_09760 [Turicibacter sp.]
MSFRIGVLSDDELETVYGIYPKNIEVLCQLLKNHYTKQQDAMSLIELGDIFTLKETVDLTKYYERDKGDPKNSCKSYKEKASSLEAINTNASPVDYYFIWTNKWNVFNTQTSEWTTINKFLNNLKKKK